MQTPLPGFSLPPLPDNFSDKISYGEETFPYFVTYSREEQEIRVFCSDTGDISIVAPEGKSRDEIRRYMYRNASRLSREVIQKRSDNTPRIRTGTLIVKGISIPYSVDYNHRRRTNSVCYYKSGRLEVQARSDATDEEITQTLEEHAEWVYGQVLQYDPHHRKIREEHTILINGEPIPYHIDFSPRARRMTIKIHPLKPLVVVVPLDADSAVVQGFVQANTRWIAGKLGKPEPPVSAHDDISYLETPERRIPYLIKESARAKQIIIRITADRSVEVIKPKKTSNEAVHLFVQEKADWIYKKVVLSTRPKAPVRRYDDGDSFPILGRDVILSINVVGEKPDISMRDGILFISIPEGLSDASHHQVVRKLVEFKLMTVLREVSAPLIQKYASLLGVSIPRVKFGNQKTRWGVCTPKGIILNIRLAMAPVDLIEYVVVHELCHIKHHNHSKQFWDLVSRQLPECQERRARLKHDGALYSL